MLDDVVGIGGATVEEKLGSVVLVWPEDIAVEPLVVGPVLPVPIVIVKLLPCADTVVATSTVEVPGSVLIVFIAEDVASVDDTAADAVAGVSKGLDVVD